LGIPAYAYMDGGGKVESGTETEQLPRNPVVLYMDTGLRQCDNEKNRLTSWNPVIPANAYMDVGGRATHDCKDAGGRVTQEQLPRKLKPGPESSSS